MKFREISAYLFFPVAPPPSSSLFHLPSLFSLFLHLVSTFFPFPLPSFILLLFPPLFSFLPLSSSFLFSHLSVSFALSPHLTFSLSLSSHISLRLPLSLPLPLSPSLLLPPPSLSLLQFPLLSSLTLAPCPPVCLLAEVVKEAHSREAFINLLFICHLSAFEGRRGRGGERGAVALGGTRGPFVQEVKRE